jgi:hypothetical protein
MPSPGSGKKPEESDDREPDHGGSNEVIVSVRSSLDEIKDDLQRLTRTVGELNSALKSTGDLLKWVLEALSRRSEEKEVMYLKSIQASNELLSSFMTFVNSRVKSLDEETAVASKEKATRKETISRESLASPGKKGDEYLVKPSMVKKLQEEEGKEKDKRNR